MKPDMASGSVACYLCRLPHFSTRLQLASVACIFSYSTPFLAELSSLFDFVAQTFSNKDAFIKSCVSVIADILSLKDSKSWLHEFSYEVLTALVGAVPLPTLQKSLLSLLLPAIGGDIIRDSAPECLALSFSILRRLNGTDHSSLPAPVRALQKHLAHDQLAAFVPPLTAAAASFPRLHIVWAHLLQWFVDHGHMTGDKDGLFAEFWNLIVEGQLITSTHEKRATALLLFSSCIGRVSADVLSTLLSRNVAHVLLSNLPKRTNVLHALARSAVESLFVACAGNSAKSATAAVQLLARGHPSFDKRAGMPVVATLVNNIDEVDLPAVVCEVKGALGTAPPPAASSDASASDSDSDEDSAVKGVQNQLTWAIQALTHDGRNTR